MGKSKIEWTEMVWNPIAGCTKCSLGCDNCYAERMTIRLNAMAAARGNNDNWAAYTDVLKWDYSQDELGRAVGWNSEIHTFSERLNIPLHWCKPRRIFVCSMSDLFHPKVPFEFIDKIFDVINTCQQHTFQILTKRPERVLEFSNSKFPLSEFGEQCGTDSWFTQLPNLYLGVTCENQKCADEKIPILLQIPAAGRWLSIEPMLGEIDLHQSRSRKDILWRRTHGGSYKRQFIDWVVVGCESGPKRRWCNNKWVRSIVDQCKAASVPVFVKQLSINGKVEHDMNKFPEWAQIREYPQ